MADVQLMRSWSTIAWAASLAAALAVASPSSAPAQAPGETALPEMITPGADAAIRSGLAYLAGTQHKTEGYWRSGAGSGGYPCAMTSLAGLALLASGNTPLEGPYAPHVRRAIEYLLTQANANPSGLIASMEEEMRPMYGHGFAMLFLAQAYGMERDEMRRQRIRKVLQRAVALTEAAQSADGGWMYTPDARTDEGSVTVTQIQGLRAVRNAGIRVPRTVIDRATDYIRKCANPDGGIRYQASQPPGSTSLPAITAAAVATMYNAGQYEHPVAQGALKFTLRVMQAQGASGAYGGHQSYAMLYAGQAMYLSGEENWKFYFPPVRDDLIRMQNRSDGSWNDPGVGPTFGTAVALLTLQLPYKHLPILQR